MTSVAPFGSWSSPITAAALVAGAAAPGEIRSDGADIWWSEARPSEGGRIQLVHRTPDGTLIDVLPEGFSARTRVHEYGGGAWAVSAGTVVFANWDDQRLYRLDPGGDAPVAITPEPAERHGLRFADLSIWRDDRLGTDDTWVVAVLERHGPDRLGTPAGRKPGPGPGDEAQNQVVAVPIEGTAGPGGAAWCQALTDPAVADFVAGPTVSPHGRLAYLSWDHPQMPWDQTTLWAIDSRALPPPPATDDLGPDSDIDRSRTLPGGDAGEAVSTVAPMWTDGSLTCLTDRSGWWNPVRWDPDTGSVTSVATVDAEIGGPLWVFGLRYLAWLPDGRFVCSLTRDGLDHLAVGAGDGSPPVPLDTPFTHISQVVGCDDGSVLVVAGTPVAESAPYRVTVPGSGTAGVVEALRPPRRLDFGDDPVAWFSLPEPIDVPTAGGATTHALLFRPTNPDVVAAEGERPPLVVLSHGGPTTAARAQLNLSIQFWTSRGFAVADVNYRGSTGYGRPFRDALKGEWGIADVEDCVAVARFLAQRGDVDPGRLAIRGGSAGGFTTLAALTFHDTFTAGASHYGIADLEVLARDTHKFESRYLDSLVGPWPEAAATYRARSPIHHTDLLACPVAIFQGLEDEVVPPAQAELIVAALRDKGVPYAYQPFAGEQHGFRQAANIIRALEGELWFYGRVFGFEPADPIEPLPGAGL